MNTGIHSFGINSISQQAALICKLQQGFKFVHADREKQKRNNCVLIDYTH